MVDTKTVARPPLKWAGGKTQLLSKLFETMGEMKIFHPRLLTMGNRTYFEPFAGGAALFFAMRATGWTGPAVLNDANAALMAIYQAIRNFPGALAREVKYHADRHSAEHFLRVRREFNANVPYGIVQAAWFIYLNKTCYNGLWRVNRRGEFNVPMDPSSLEGRTICDEENLMAVHAALENVTLKGEDFELAVADAKRGDLVYFDPPYWPRGGEADFVSYVSAGFSSDDQVRVRDTAWDLKQRGVHVIVTNADVPGVRRLYDSPRFNLREVKARRNINSVAKSRGPVGELIIT